MPRRRRRVVEANLFNVSNMLPDSIDIDLPVWRIRLVMVRVWLRNQARRAWNRVWLRRSR